MNKSLQIIKELKLDDYLKIVITESTSNNAPYHNFYHVMCKIKNTYEIALSEGFLLEHIRVLILIDLFHDFNHSMGLHNDEWNVNTACAAFTHYSKETDEVNKKVISGIKATQYPYVIEDEDLTLEQKIIRDSDLLQQFENNYIQQVYFGLSQELKYSFEQMLHGYPVFIDNMKLYTNHAQNIHDERINSNIEDVEYLLSILK